MAEIIRTKVLTDKKGMAKKGKNGRKYFEQNFTKSKCIDNLCKVMFDNK